MSGFDAWLPDEPYSLPDETVEALKRRADYEVTVVPVERGRPMLDQARVEKAHAVLGERGETWPTWLTPERIIATLQDLADAVTTVETSRHDVAEQLRILAEAIPIPDEPARVIERRKYEDPEPSARAYRYEQCRIELASRDVTRRAQYEAGRHDGWGGAAGALGALLEGLDDACVRGDAAVAKSAADGVRAAIVFLSYFRSCPTTEEIEHWVMELSR